jgi:Phosphatidylethanolamine-binding protein
MLPTRFAIRSGTRHERHRPTRRARTPARGTVTTRRPTNARPALIPIASGPEEERSRPAPVTRTRVQTRGARGANGLAERASYGPILRPLDGPSHPRLTKEPRREHHHPNHAVITEDHLVTAIDAHKRDPYAGLPAVPGFRLESTAVADVETMPVAQRSGIFGAGGNDSSPDLAWPDYPRETQSFIVTMYDPDAPTPSGFWHWVVINIPHRSRRCRQARAMVTRHCRSDQRIWPTTPACVAISARPRHLAIHIATTLSFPLST